MSKQLTSPFIEALKAIPETAKEGRLSLESTYSALLNNKKISQEDIAAAVAGFNAPACEIAKCFQGVISSQAALSQQRHDCFAKTIDIQKTLLEKAETAEERKEHLTALLETQKMLIDQEKESRAFSLKVLAIIGGIVVSASAITVFVRNPKLGGELIKVGAKLLKK